MGDRCTVRIVEDGSDPSEGPSMYLHWDGEFETVYALCVYCRARGYRCGVDSSYGLARLVAVAGNYVDPTGGLSLGVRNGYEEEWDNGHYTVADDWRIVGWSNAWRFKAYATEDGRDSPWVQRGYGRPGSGRGTEYVPTYMGRVRRLLLRIDASMPEHARLGTGLSEAVWSVAEEVMGDGAEEAVHL